MVIKLNESKIMLEEEIEAHYPNKLVLYEICKAPKGRVPEYSYERCQGARRSRDAVGATLDIRE